MSTAVLSIGSNLGDRLAALQSVVDGLGSRVVAVSHVFETAPWGGVEQDDFLNAVVIAFDHDFGPVDWLDAAHGFENAADRVREQRWGPRTLDVDIISVDGVTSTDPALTLPHPRAHERAFVLLPWLDIDPHAVLGNRPVAELLSEIAESERSGVRISELSLRWSRS